VNLYVYYDVDAGAGTALAHDVRAMQADLRRTSGVAGRLMKRPPSGDARETWMEVYEGVDDAFESRVEEAATTIDWRGAGPRHVERFIDC